MQNSAASSNRAFAGCELRSPVFFLQPRVYHQFVVYIPSSPNHPELRIVFHKVQSAYVLQISISVLSIFYFILFFFISLLES